MAEGPAIIVSQDGPVARVTMNRPAVHNAFNEEVIAALAAAFQRLGQDERVRAVVLAGEGPSFSAGADLEWMRRAASWSEEENRRDALALAAMLRSIAECPRPVVARVQGNAFGGGVGLVAAADLAVATRSAQFAFTEVRLGLAPATISPYVVEKIGPGWALRLFLTGERVSAQRAQEIGLVYRVVPDEELDAAVEETLRALLSGGPHAQAEIKRLVRTVVASRGPQVDEFTSSLIAGLRTGTEGQEGIRAFLERRRPEWSVH
ncbi:Short-chain-enoyl-CoA hydratase [bacterium HR25]|jgi:methylglutaconyl-CoA hydratase|nr:Short-chain-enoyl-CoA hydratase [bacterium HR25]